MLLSRWKDQAVLPAPGLLSLLSEKNTSQARPCISGECFRSLPEQTCIYFEVQCSYSALWQRCFPEEKKSSLSIRQCYQEVCLFLSPILTWYQKRKIINTTFYETLKKFNFLWALKKLIPFSSIFSSSKVVTICIMLRRRPKRPFSRRFNRDRIRFCPSTVFSDVSLYYCRENKRFIRKHIVWNFCFWYWLIRALFGLLPHVSKINRV